jgi:phosphopantothenoylcysteine decarboxylase/phosphopantothenate--cysteine ligase
MNESAKPDWSGYEVLLGLTGGIACYKAADLASKLVTAGMGVSAVMTASAEEFLRSLTLAALTGRPVYDSLWTAGRGQHVEMHHVSLTERADLMVIAPATANIMAKMAAGIADDLLSTLALSAWGSCPILVAPAMNTRMWSAPSTQANLATLRQRGVECIGPGSGRLACGDVGAGRMAEPADILDAVVNLLKKNPPKRAAG